MAKAGTGKGNAFCAPGPSYASLEIVRKEAQAQQEKRNVSLTVAGVDIAREDLLRAHANIIPDGATNKRVKTDMNLAISRARVGKEPIVHPIPRQGCDGCRRSSGSGTHHFLCQSENKKQFKTKEEKAAYQAFVPAVKLYAAEMRAKDNNADDELEAPPPPLGSSSNQAAVVSIRQDRIPISIDRSAISSNATPAGRIGGAAASSLASSPSEQKQKSLASRQNLWFCNCREEWPRPKGTQGNPHHQDECRREQATKRVITEQPIAGETVLHMLPRAKKAGRRSRRFSGPGQDDWEETSEEEQSL